MFPLNIAHRGASGEAIENSLEAFELALKQGCDGIEFDCRLTKDNRVIVFHDDTLKRLADINIHVEKSNYSEIKKYQLKNQQTIPLLEDLLDLYKNQNKVLNFEIKWDRLRSKGLEEKIVQKIREFKLEGLSYISSFNPLTLLRLKKIAPEMKRGFLVSPDHPVPRRPFLIKATNPHSINLNPEWLNTKRFQFYKKFQKKIWLWTINDEDEMKKWNRREVEAIITNYPAKLKKVLEESKKIC